MVVLIHVTYMLAKFHTLSECSVNTIFLFTGQDYDVAK